MSKVRVFIQDQLVIMVSTPSFINRKRGSRLMKNASFTAVSTCVRPQAPAWGRGCRVVSTGYSSNRKMKARLVVIIREAGYIADTWICTKSFWCLRPADELLSFISQASEPWGLTKVAKISSFRCFRASLG